MATERELFKLLSDQLGVVIQRNYAARWIGGCGAFSVQTGLWRLNATKP